ncbi:MAG: hypothetical protein JNK53_07985, partial [Phycisphaerae bacterium]|nr:hypothetical protein [Phycisphaerae bacterium]
MKTALVSFVAVGCLAPAAWSQSFNIDVGNATPTPGATYGAAAGSAGVWNTYVGGVQAGLLGLNGSATGVGMSGTGGFLGGYNDPGTFGDDEALMDDSLLIPFAETYTVSGLAAGLYDVYVYTWTFTVLSTDVQVNGQGFQAIGG